MVILFFIILQEMVINKQLIKIKKKIIKNKKIGHKKIVDILLKRPSLNIRLKNNKDEEAF